MRNNFGLSSFVLAAAGLASISAASAIARTNHAAAGVVKRATNSTAIAPKVVIVNMFEPEGAAFWGIPEFDVLAQNITVPGLSPLFPEVHCTADGEVCQVITGEAEINAASTISAFVLSPLFDLTKSYFMIGGIAGVNPEVGTLGSVGFARYAVQVALQYEIDMRDLPDNFTTG
jgi:purine nucleoside permease